MNLRRLFAIIFIFCCTCFAWALLWSGLQYRSGKSQDRFYEEVGQIWGSKLYQSHPRIYFWTPHLQEKKKLLTPVRSDVAVHLDYAPVKKGLSRFRAYEVSFAGKYLFENSTPITQTFYLDFSLPSKEATYRGFRVRLGGREHALPENGEIALAAELQPGEQCDLEIFYRSRGLDEWRYVIGAARALENFHLSVETNFVDIDFPMGTGSPTQREEGEKGWKLVWEYPEVIGAQDMGMAMPKILKPAEVASRITFFAPVSLLFYFAIFWMATMLLRVSWHPMNYFFLAAGFFAFHLLFAYLVDRVPTTISFGIAAGVSLALIGFYVYMASGRKLATMSTLAQFAYLVLFSYSFFFDGITGLTIAIGAIATLALLMGVTAKVDWSSRFTSSARLARAPEAGA